MDAEILKAHRRTNRWQSILLLLAVGAVLFLIAYSLFGITAGWMAVGFAVLLFVFTPAVSPSIVLRMYRAKPLKESQAPALFDLVQELSKRAELPKPPDLYYLPSDVMNAFTVGRKKHAVIAVSDGLLRRLNLAELAGVLAHEMAHIQNNDVRLMGFADVAGRVVGSLSRLGQFLLLLNLPLILMGQSHIPWLTIGVLVLAPILTQLAQLALSRTREFEADASAAELIGDPRPLAAALKKIEEQSQSMLAKMFGGRKGLREPSLMRTHPHTHERIERLKGLRRSAAQAAAQGLLKFEQAQSDDPRAQSAQKSAQKSPQESPQAETPIPPRWHRTGTWF